MRSSIAIVAYALTTLARIPANCAELDPRHIESGLRIPDEGYCDQPYVVALGDGTWLCTLTTGAGREGESGQHVVSTVSKDQGKTWSPLLDIEPADGPEASWVVPFLTPGGRVYVFYTYNGDEVRKLPSGKPMRADVQGWLAMKYSDDGGRSWSSDRYRLPMRITACDRQNDFQGQMQMFWGIDKPKSAGESVYFAFTKLGRYLLEQGEGWLFASDNLLTEPNVAEIHWELRPDGEHGIRGASYGSVQEEHNLVPLGGDALYCVYRTTLGHPCQAYSEDGGRTWSQPEPMVDAPGGRVLRQPRACPKIWRCSNGKYLFWYHLHGGKSYQGRNPAWLAGGALKDGRLHWSQPEIVLYDDDPKTGMSYPDLIEDGGRYWITETQKTIARVHEVDPSLLEGLWNQGQVREVTRKGLLDETREEHRELRVQLDLQRCSGATLECWIRLDTVRAGQELASSVAVDGRGISLTTEEKGALRWTLSDGETKATWVSDAGRISSQGRHHVVAIADRGPRILSFVIDGRVSDGSKQGDGGEERPCGWGRWNGTLRDVSGTGQLRLARGVQCARIYDRYLRTSEAIAHYHAGPQAISEATADSPRVWRATGIPVPELESVEAVLKEFMISRRISRCALAVTREGRLVLARGFTWDRLDVTPTQPDSRFRIASVSKPLTAVAVLGLVEEGKLSLEEKVVDVLGLEPSEGRSMDPRFRKVTVRHLLQHLGGWDRDRAYDPMFQDERIARTLKIALPISASDIVSFMAGEPLQHEPGTTYAYSNFGYCLLGRVIERRSERDYEEYVKERVLAPLGLVDTRLGRTKLEDRAPGEVQYEDERRSPYTSFNLENMDAHGGWIASAVDLAKFAVAFDRPSACPVLSEASIETLFGLPENLPAETYRPGESYYACGWSVRDFGNGARNTWHAGSLPGTYTLLARWRSGVHGVVLFNRRAADSPTIDPIISEAIRGVPAWPSHDLFRETGRMRR